MSPPRIIDQELYERARDGVVHRTCTARVVVVEFENRPRYRRNPVPAAVAHSSVEIDIARAEAIFNPHGQTFDVEMRQSISTAREEVLRPGCVGVGNLVPNNAVAPCRQEIGGDRYARPPTFGKAARFVGDDGDAVVASCQLRSGCESLHRPG